MLRLDRKAIWGGGGRKMRDGGLGRASVEVEGPLRGGLAGGADQAGGLEDGCHAIGRVDEGAEGVLLYSGA